MERSPELESLMLRYYEAVSEGNLAFMDRFFSRRSELLLIGTAPNEWFTDLAAMKQSIKALSEAGIRGVAGDLTAYREGSVGWVTDRPKFVLPDGTESPARWSAVFHQEDGEWRLIQGHASVGVPDSEVIGTNLDLETSHDRRA